MKVHWEYTDTRTCILHVLWGSKKLESRIEMNGPVVMKPQSHHHEFDLGRIILDREDVIYMNPYHKLDRPSLIELALLRRWIFSLDERVLWKSDGPSKSVYQAIQFGPPVLYMEEKPAWKITYAEIKGDLTIRHPAPRDWYHTSGRWKDSQYEYLAREIVNES